MHTDNTRPGLAPEMPCPAARQYTENRAYVGTPGAEYVTRFLSDACPADVCWLIEAVNSGELVACPHCHFLHLPTLPFPLDALGRADACDVCANVPDAATLPNHYDSVSKALETAPGYLQDCRDARAEALYALWRGHCNGSDALIWAAMAQAVTSAVEGAKGEGGEAKPETE